MERSVFEGFPMLIFELFSYLNLLVFPLLSDQSPFISVFLLFPSFLRKTIHKKEKRKKKKTMGNNDEKPSSPTDFMLRMSEMERQLSSMTMCDGSSFTCGAEEGGEEEEFFDDGTIDLDEDFQDLGELSEEEDDETEKTESETEEALVDLQKRRAFLGSYPLRLDAEKDEEYKEAIDKSVKKIKHLKKSTKKKAKTLAVALAEFKMMMFVIKKWKKKMAVAGSYYSGTSHGFKSIAVASSR